MPCWYSLNPNGSVVYCTYARASAASGKIRPPQTAAGGPPL